MIFKLIICNNNQMNNQLIIESNYFGATGSHLPIIQPYVPNRLGVQYHSSTLKSHIKHIKRCGMGNKVWIVSCYTHIQFTRSWTLS